MLFFSHLGPSLLCVTLLLSLPVHGSELRIPIYLNPHGVIPSCCTDSSTAPIQEAIKACTEQKPDMFKICPIHAYILTAASGASYCVDPAAMWLHEKLEELRKEGIQCKVL